MATATVKIIKGEWRSKEISNVTATLVCDYRLTVGKKHAGQGYLTCTGSIFGDCEARVYVDSPKDYIITGEVRSQNGVDHDIDPVVTVPAAVEETDEEIMNRIAKKMSVMERLTYGVAEGHITSLLCSSGAGTGKTFLVEQVLNDCVENSRMHNKYEVQFESMTGVIKPIHLYMKLYSLREKHQVLVLDDINVFDDLDMLQIFKGALDSKPSRTIHWESSSRILVDHDVPTSFQYEGSVIFITNTDLKNTKGALAPHKNALLSRSHYIDIGCHTKREQRLRIQQVVYGNDMLAQYQFSQNTKTALMNFITKHEDNFQELSLRLVTKLAGLIKAFPDNNEWMEIAECSLMK